MRFALNTNDKASLQNTCNVMLKIGMKINDFQSKKKKRPWSRYGHDYPIAYQNDGRKIVKVGVNYSS